MYPVVTKGRKKLLLFRFYLIFIVLAAVLGSIGLIIKNQNLVHRSITATVLLHLLCLVLWGGPYAFAAFAAAVLLLGVYEITGLLKVKRVPWMTVSLVFGGFLFWHDDWLPFLLPLFLGFSLYAFVGSRERIRSRLYMCGFMVFVLAPCAAAFAAIGSLSPGWIMFMVLLLQFNDVFGYVFDKLFGKRNVFKAISPNKTLEGYLGSAAMVAVGAVLLYTLVPVLQGYPLAQSLPLVAYMFVFGNGGICCSLSSRGD